MAAPESHSYVAIETRSMPARTPSTVLLLSRTFCRTAGAPVMPELSSGGLGVEWTRPYAIPPVTWRVTTCRLTDCGIDVVSLYVIVYKCWRSQKFRRLFFVSRTPRGRERSFMSVFETAACGCHTGSQRRTGMFLYPFYHTIATSGLSHSCSARCKLVG